MPNLSTPILIALMVVAFYLLILRPQKKRQQAVQQTLSSLGPGSRVLLSSGLFGTVVAMGARQAVLEISPGVELTVLKQAIVRTVTDADEDDLDADDDDLDDDAGVTGTDAFAPQEIDARDHDAREHDAADVAAQNLAAQNLDTQNLDTRRGADDLGSTGVDAAAPEHRTPSAGADSTRLG
jgi:preprotein translocase subunit YajC